MGGELHWIMQIEKITQKNNMELIMDNQITMKRNGTQIPKLQENSKIIILNDDI